MEILQFGNFNHISDYNRSLKRSADSDICPSSESKRAAVAVCQMSTPDQTYSSFHHEGMENKTIDSLVSI